MKNILMELGNVPVSSSTILSLYPDLKSKRTKIGTLEKANEIIRLKRNLFIVNPDETSIKLSTGLIANHLLAPSYVSMQTALRFYGLIPEAVYTTQSMTFKAARDFQTPVGNFRYLHISREAYPVGITQIKEGNVVYVMATPEKALCDLLANTSGVNLRFKKEALTFLEDDLRLDMEKFQTFDRMILEEYAKVGKKAMSVQTIIKLLSDYE